MIPAPNDIAGILIGIANDTIAIKLIASIGWGFIFLGYIQLKDEKGIKEGIKKFRAVNGKTKIGFSPKITFYIIEYITAFITSFIFAMLTGLIKGIF